MRIGVAISGGMDSAASGLLLKEEGHELIALHMRLFEDSEASITKAQRVANLIKAPLHVIDLENDFQKTILDHFAYEYSLGRTPSPCPRCNRLIKMTLLADHARSLGCQKLATGHYANIVHQQDIVTLTKGHDAVKDQSYFLFMLTPEQLEFTCFPLGSWKKSQVRAFLSSIDRELSESEESQELCFIKNDDYVSFLKQMGIQSEPGPILDTQGNILGHHNGIINYTVGQRKGLGVCGPAPRYVIRIDSQTNSVIIGTRDETFSNGALVTDLNIIRRDLAFSNKCFQVKIRSTSRPTNCKITRMDQTSLEFVFAEPQSSVAPGQAAVFYFEDIVVMGGWIDAPK
ncbi:MAG: tRNA 2-thiouridine(34) synthase MnmA [Syntrophaceae bacterium]|nr:tRNA 2-thiouridine(34) synthase MnmA [Syntrophaceae bacterium]